MYWYEVLIPFHYYMIFNLLNINRKDNDEYFIKEVKIIKYSIIIKLLIEIYLICVKYNEILNSKNYVVIAILIGLVQLYYQLNLYIYTNYSNDLYNSDKNNKNLLVSIKLHFIVTLLNNILLFDFADTILWNILHVLKDNNIDDIKFMDIYKKYHQPVYFYVLIFYLRHLFYRILLKGIYDIYNVHKSYYCCFVIIIDCFLCFCSLNTFEYNIENNNEILNSNKSISIFIILLLCNNNYLEFMKFILFFFKINNFYINNFNNYNLGQKIIVIEIIFSIIYILYYIEYIIIHNFNKIYFTASEIDSESVINIIFSNKKINQYISVSYYTDDKNISSFKIYFEYNTDLIPFEIYYNSINHKIFYDKYLEDKTESEYYLTKRWRMELENNNIIKIVEQNNNSKSKKQNKNKYISFINKYLLEICFWKSLIKTFLFFPIYILIQELFGYIK